MQIQAIIDTSLLDDDAVDHLCDSAWVLEPDRDSGRLDEASYRLGVAVGVRHVITLLKRGMG